MLLMPRLGLFAFLCWIVIIFVAAGFPAWLLGQPGFSSPCGRFSSPGKWVGASPPGQPPAIGNMKTPSCLATDISSMFHLRWRSSWFLWTWSVRVVSRGGPQVLGSSWKVVSIVPIQAIRKSAPVPEVKMSAYAGGILISTWSSALCRRKTFITMFASAVREKQMPMGIFIALNCLILLHWSVRKGQQLKLQKNTVTRVTAEQIFATHLNVCFTDPLPAVPQTHFTKCSKHTSPRQGALVPETAASTASAVSSDASAGAQTIVPWVDVWMFDV